MITSIDHLDQILQLASDNVGVPLDIFKLISYLIINIPLCLLLREINQPLIRKYFQLTLGIVFLLFLGKEWFVYIVGVVLSIYLTVQYVQIKQKYLLCVSMAFMGLAYVHVYRILYDYLSWKMDFTTVQMIVTCRLVYYAYDQTSTSQTKHDLWDFLGYVFMFPCLLLAPVTFPDYVNFTYLRDNYKQIPHNNRDWVISLLKALVLAGGEFIIRPHFDLDRLSDVDWKESNLLNKYVIMMVVGICLRFKYFCAFYFVQSSLHALGITYNNQNKFDRYVTCNYRYEIEPNSIIKTSYWNSMVQNWLKVCIYERTQHLGQSVAFYTTFLLSALWHGFYLTYYFLFFWWALINQICKYGYKARDRLKWVPLGSLLSLILSSALMTPPALGVAILEWNRAMQLQQDTYWSAQILTISIFLFFYITQFGGSSKIIGNKEVKKQK